MKYYIFEDDEWAGMTMRSFIDETSLATHLTKNYSTVEQYSRALNSNSLTIVKGEIVTPQAKEVTKILSFKISDDDE